MGKTEHHTHMRQMTIKIKQKVTHNETQTTTRAEDRLTDMADMGTRTGNVLTRKDREPFENTDLETQVRRH